MARVILRGDIFDVGGDAPPVSERDLEGRGCRLDQAYSWLVAQVPGGVNLLPCRDGCTVQAYPRSGDDISESTFVEKAKVVAMLRSRELHGRADWVGREFAELIDTAKNAALLRTLGIDVATMTANAPSGREVATAN